MRNRDLARRLLLGWLVLALASAAHVEAAAAAPAEAAARQVVRETIDAVLAALDDSSLSPEARRDRIESIAYERFDFATISKLILARNWKRLSESQRDEFLVEFKRHLSLTYGDGLEDYQEETVTIGGTRPEKNGDVSVRTEVHGRGEPIRVEYRMREREGHWRVIDVIIDGVSLLSNFRAQTQEIISEVGADGLIQRLREKNADREAKS
jgi:phospholipid transport system substrate-binding protein